MFFNYSHSIYVLFICLPKCCFRLIIKLHRRVCARVRECVYKMAVYVCSAHGDYAYLCPITVIMLYDQWKR